MVYYATIRSRKALICIWSDRTIVGLPRGSSSWLHCVMPVKLAILVRQAWSRWSSRSVSLVEITLPPPRVPVEKPLLKITKWLDQSALKVGRFSLWWSERQASQSAVFQNQWRRPRKAGQGDGAIETVLSEIDWITKRSLHGRIPSELMYLLYFQLNSARVKTAQASFGYTLWLAGVAPRWHPMSGNHLVPNWVWIVENLRIWMVSRGSFLPRQMSSSPPKTITHN